METLLAFVIGAIFAGAIYLMLRRSIVKLIMGLALLGHAANLLIFAGAGLTRGSPPLVPPDAAAPVEPIADPLPQALILTAIVIAFAVLAFAIVLIYRAYQAVATDDLDAMKSTDELPPPTDYAAPTEHAAEVDIPHPPPVQVGSVEAPRSGDHE